MNLDPAVLIRVVPAEGVGESLQRDGELDKVIEGDRPAVLAVELLDEEIHGGRLKAITHHPQRRCQLVLVDETRVVPIVAAESLLPLGHVVPQLGELLEVNGTGVVVVEHHDHLPDRLGIKRSPSPVGQGLAQLHDGYLTGPILVHLREDVPQKLRIGSRHSFARARGREI